MENNTVLVNNYMFFQIVQGNILEETTDAIVNPSNGHLMQDGKIAKALGLKAGPKI